MVSWLEMAQRHPESRGAIIEHLKDNIRQKKDWIAFENSEIGVMVRLRESFPTNNAMKDWSRYFINLHVAEIEYLTEGVEDDRREIDEITRL